jgi:hypothetical protein
MKKKRWTAEEWRAYCEDREASIRTLRGHAERIKVELEAKRRQQPA